MKQCCEYVWGLQYKLRMMGIPVIGWSFLYGDNQSVLCNTCIPDSNLKKKNHAIAYHFVQEGVAREEWVDTDLAGDKVIRRSVTGFVIYLNQAPNYPILSLWEPVDGRLVQVYYKAGPGGPDHFIYHKVCINISDHVETLSLWRRRICWDNLLYLTIVFSPIMPREIIIVNGGVCWVKDHPSPVFTLGVRKDVKEFV